MKFMKKHHLFLFFAALLIVFAFLSSYTKPKESEYIFDDSLYKPDSIFTIKVITAGDAMAHLPQITGAYDAKSKTYDFYPVFKYLNPISDTGN